MKHLSLQKSRLSGRGFTLIELMIVVAIIGILAAIAYPSYAESIKRGRRADAQKALLEAAQYMQRYYAAHNTYATSDTAKPDVALPDALKRSPSDPDTTKAYDITVTGSTVKAYQLNATPTGPMSNDRCGTFTLTSQNVKGVSASTVAACWK